MDIFNVIAEPTRRHIIETLAKHGALPATNIYDRFDASHPAVSQHLKVLREANLVRVEKEGRERRYELNFEKVYEFERWTRSLEKVWNGRFDRLEKVLEVEKKKLLKAKKQNK